jgi:hypothetical protein
MRLKTLTIAAALAIAPASADAQQANTPRLHLSNRWKECSFQLDPSLTQTAWRQFTGEAGLVTYFRPLADARPLGRGKFEVSVLQWETAIDDRDSAWNDTFVHPDSEHWLFEGSGLKFPGLMLRAGVTEKTDLSAYFTRNPNANYGFVGGELQHNLAQSADRSWSAAARVSGMSLFGPEDVSFTMVGADLVASKSISVTRWAELSPYAGASAYLGNSHEKSAVVNLADEHVLGVRATAGAELRISKVRLAAEYSAAKVGSFSMKIGFGQ